MPLPRHPHSILLRAQPMRLEQETARLHAAAALAADGERVMLAWGGLAPASPVPGGVTLWLLPPAWERADAAGLILDAEGRPVDHAWKKRRAAALLALFAGMAPRLVILDRAAPGFRFELEPLTEIARRREPAPDIREFI
ncbi:hypothetical protein [Niveispirillum sp.]|uniref:hypothetical protein n=1 Tax=Niveispirillum sp. TaxID=1917217 RepID=UPI001B5D56E1|nr:hypothetical protein [Niveispirillum sp.]MBP7338844.1 hypothetical protein [Niveispirillum sp.]